MNDRIVFRKELAVVERVGELLKDPGVQNNPLAEELGRLLEDYERLFRQSSRIVRLSDRQQQELRELNDLKNKFLGMAAHDLRNPCVVIRDSVWLIKQDNLVPEESKGDFLDIISRVSEDMLRLVEDFLDVSVIESGRLAIRAVPTSLNELLERRVQFMGLIAERKKMTLQLETAPMPESTLDVDRIGQVVDNFIGNAIKFSDPGSTILIRSGLVDGQPFFTVTDTGPGLSQSDREKMFGTFQTLSAVPTGGEKSTGLGLAIAKKVVSAHGGRIEVDSEIGKGTTFRVILPLAGSDGVVESLENAELPEAADAAEEPDWADMPRPRILLVDDEPMLRMVVKAALQHMRWDVVGEAASGAEALEQYEALKPDLILLDINMPQMDGIEALRRLRRADPQVLVVMLTAEGHEEIIAECIIEGAEDYVHKDRSLEILSDRLLQTWEIHLQRRAQARARALAHS